MSEQEITKELEELVELEELEKLLNGDIKVPIEESRVNYHFRGCGGHKNKHWRLLDDRIIYSKKPLFGTEEEHEYMLMDVRFHKYIRSIPAIQVFKGNDVITLVGESDSEELRAAAKYIEQNTGSVWRRKSVVNDTTEHRMRCNVCGKVFCYTEADVLGNQSHAKWAVAHAVGSMANAAFGSAYLMNEESKKADMETSKIRDFSKCPYCNSSSIVEITMEEWEKSLNEKNPSNNPVGGSVADEIKKFKELLDIGAITQEEFDAKKKQLLGL